MQHSLLINNVTSIEQKCTGTTQGGSSRIRSEVSRARRELKVRLLGTQKLAALIIRAREMENGAQEKENARERRVCVREGRGAAIFGSRITGEVVAAVAATRSSIVVVCTTQDSERQRERKRKRERRTSYTLR